MSYIEKAELLNRTNTLEESQAILNSMTHKERVSFFMNLRHEKPTSKENIDSNFLSHCIELNGESLESYAQRNGLMTFEDFHNKLDNACNKE
jgi:hypothetical protein